MISYYIEFTPEGTFVYEEKVDGLNPDAVEVVPIEFYNKAIEQRNTYIRAYNRLTAETIIQELDKE